MCEYCKENDEKECVAINLIDEQRQGLFDEVVFQLYIDYGKLVMYVDNIGGSQNYFESQKKINYCPMCGRKLSE